MYFTALLQQPFGQIRHPIAAPSKLTRDQLQDEVKNSVAGAEDSAVLQCQMSSHGLELKSYTMGLARMLSFAGLDTPSLTMTSLPGATWVGPAVDDHVLLALLPAELQDLLSAVNGFILHDGALHVRGAVLAPEWHSLRAVWQGEESLSRLYPKVRADDLPFAQDCVGDQFLLRDERVLRLEAETGRVEEISPSLFDFLRDASTNPDETLSPQPLEQYQLDGGELEPGQLLHVSPPYCTLESEDGVTLRAIDAQELLRFHADFAARIRGLPSGSRIKISLRP